MKKVLFVCTGNTCRSPMAQGIFNKMCSDKCIDAKADSAGIFANALDTASENSAIVCKEIGVDISNRKAVPIDRVNLSQYDLICPMTVEHAQMLVSLGADRDKICVMNIPDPFGGDLDIYRKCREEIEKALGELIEKL